MYEFVKDSGSNLISSNAHYANELGYLLILQGCWKEASEWYAKASELNENTADSMTGRLLRIYLFLVYFNLVSVFLQPNKIKTFGPCASLKSLLGLVHGVTWTLEEWIYYIQ